MNKDGLVREIECREILPKSVIEPIVNCALDVIRDELANGGEVRLCGFGVFTDIDYKEKTITVTGEEIYVPAHKCPKFRPSTQLKAAVREGTSE